MGVTDQIPAPALVLDENAVVIEANGEACACLGLSASDLASGGLTRAVTRPQLLTGAIRTAAPSGAWTIELEATRPNGVPFPLDVSGRVIDHGPPRQALALLRDRNADADGLASLARRHFDAAFESAPIGMAIYSTDGRFIRVNEAMCEMLGRTAYDLLGTRDQDLTHPEDRATDLDAAQRILAGEIDTFQTEKRFVRPDGSVRWAIANLNFLRDDRGRPISWLGQFQDVSEHRRLAERDSLTHLYNRRRFEHELARQLAHGVRYKPPGALVVFDLDGFKEINDGHGHHAGDEVLQAVAKSVTDRVRETDLVARLGGDEFAVVMPHSDAGGAELLGRSLVELIAGLRFDFAPDRSVVTASVGVTPFGDDAATEPVLAAADAALYEVKRDGGNGCAVKQP